MTTPTLESPSLHRSHNRLRRWTSGPSSVAVFLAFLVATIGLAVPSVYAISARSTNAVSISTAPQKSSNGNDTNDDNSSNDNGKRRGKVLEEQFDELDLMRAYEEIKSEYHEKAFGGCALPQNGEQSWKLLTTMNPNKKQQHRWKNNSDDAAADDDDEIIRVSMLEHPSDPLCPYVKMETVIPMPVEKCWDFLSLDKWDETMPKMDPFYEGLDIYGEYSIPGGSVDKDADMDNTGLGEESDAVNGAVKMILARKRTKRILAFGKREFVFVSVEDTPLEDGTWVSGTVSVEVPETERHESEIDPSDGEDSKNGASAAATAALHSLRRNKLYTRAFQDSIAFYKPLPAKDCSSKGSSTITDRTRLTIVCRIDLNDSSGKHGSGGCIPMWLYVKTIGITGARSVLSMRNCLLKGEE